MWEVGSSPGIVSSGQWPHAFLCWSSQCQGRWFRGPNNAESQPWGKFKSLGHSHRKVSFIPRGFNCVTRVEELSFPNGRIYKMKSTLVRDTEYSLMDSKCTQTDDVPARVIPLPCFQMWCFHTSFHCLDLHPGRLADPSVCVFLLCPIPSDWNSSVYKWEHLISEMLYIVLTI